MKNFKKFNETLGPASGKKDNLIQNLKGIPLTTDNPMIIDIVKDKESSKQNNIDDIEIEMEETLVEEPKVFVNKNKKPKKMKRTKKFEEIYENIKNHDFNYHNQTWEVRLIYDGAYRIIDKYRSWFIVKTDTIEDAIIEAKEKIDRIFSNGDPIIHPRKGQRYVVTDNNINFTTGAHWQRPGGTGSKNVLQGDIIIFNRQGEDNGFWYIPTDDTDLKGGKAWSLIYDEKIKAI